MRYITGTGTGNPITQLPFAMLSVLVHSACALTPADSALADGRDFNFAQGQEVSKVCAATKRNSRAALITLALFRSCGTAARASSTRR